MVHLTHSSDSTTRHKRSIESKKTISNDYKHLKSALDKATPGRFGIDKLTIASRISESDYRSTDHWTKLWGRQGGGTVPRSRQVRFGSRKVTLVVYRDRDFQPWCSISLNPSRFVDPVGDGLCRPEDIFLTIESAVMMASKYLSLFTPTGEMIVKRLDVAKDRVVKYSLRYVQGLAGVHRPYATVDEPGSQDGNSWRAGSQSGGTVTIYDKGRQTGGKVADGLMRIEAQCRPRWLRTYGGISTVEDLTPQRIKDLARDRFQWFGFGREVISTGAAIERIWKDSWLDIRVKRGLSQYLRTLAFGKQPRISVPTESRYRTVLKKMNIAPRWRTIPRQVGTVNEFDLNSGTDVASA